MKYEVRFTAQFKKDFKLAQKRNRDIKKLTDVIELLANGSELPLGYRDHLLNGNFHECRECHISPDWLLIYKIFNDILVLECMRTGSHSDLFR